MSSVSLALSIVLFLAYLGWGIYTLRLRYAKNEDLPIKLELITLAAVAVFIIFEVLLVRPSLAQTPVIFMFTVLGLAVSTAALYGPMLVSVASQAFVEVLLPSHDPRNDAPEFGPVEALERIGDYEGALQECMVVARIFPKDPGVALRIAGNLGELERHAEAAEWFERGLVRLNDSDRAFRVTNRLAEIYARQLDRPEDAERVMNAFLERYPEHERADSLRSRIERLSAGATARSLPIPEASSE